MAGVEDLKGYAIAVGALAVVDLVTIAVVIGYKDSAVLGNCSNASTQSAGCSAADKFVTGLTIFATFIGVIILAIIGKIIVGLYKKES
jgi:uncharacterized membrane protein SpoIIM required for sporulation